MVFRNIWYLIAIGLLLIIPVVLLWKWRGSWLAVPGVAVLVYVLEIIDRVVMVVVCEKMFGKYISEETGIFTALWIVLGLPIMMVYSLVVKLIIGLFKQ